MRKKVIATIVGIACIFFIVLGVVNSSSYTIDATIYVSLEKDNVFLEKLSDETFSAASERRYIELGYVPYKTVIEFNNNTLRNYAYSVIPKIETEDYILEVCDAESVSTLFQGVQKLNDIAIGYRMWFKETLSKDDIKKIIDDINLQVEFLYYLYPLTADTASIKADCKMIVVDKYPENVETTFF